MITPSIIYANAQLDFYPADFRDRAPRVADVVVPLPTASVGAFTLNTTADQLSQSVTLPQNTEEAYLDVFAQSQSTTSSGGPAYPAMSAANWRAAANTAFRETEITIDGKPAGIAPVYPWIYTGGVDPFLWEPIPGVQTLNFKPFRVNLTPFAGVLADGDAHTVGISVFNANSYFLATANLLVFTDPHAQRTNGGLLSDTLAAAPTPVVSEKLNTDSSGNITGTVGVSSARNYSISGWLTTSHGRVETTVDATRASATIRSSRSTARNTFRTSRNRPRWMFRPRASRASFHSGREALQLPVHLPDRRRSCFRWLHQRTQHLESGLPGDG